MSGSALRETFSALDAQPGAGGPTWTHGTSKQAEAGFQDPALGWIGVRAGTSGGGIHAALVPGSAQGADELEKHMDGIHNYLTEQHIPVESLRMDASGVSSTETASGFQGGDKGSGHQSQQSDPGNGAGTSPGGTSETGTKQQGAGNEGTDENGRRGWTQPNRREGDPPVTEGLSGQAMHRGDQGYGAASKGDARRISLVA